MSLPKTCKSAMVHSRKEPGKVIEVSLPEPKKNQVVVKIAYAPINPSDVGTLEGWYPVQVRPPHSVGYEGSGTIAAVGEELLVPHKVGDKVHVFGIGTWSEYVVLPSEQCFPVKPNVSLEEAASHYVNPGTVVYMSKLVERGGHKAAIHTAGASALGRMIIRYFKEKGIKLINVVRKEEYVKELLAEGADYVLNMESPDFYTNIKALALKEKATICFEAIAGEFTGKLIRVMPPNSEMYVYGSLSGKDVSGVSVVDLAFTNKKVTGLWLQTYFKELMKKGETGTLFKEIHGRIDTTFKSHIQKVYSLDDLQAAIEFYKKNSSKGKILIKPHL